MRDGRVMSPSPPFYLAAPSVITEVPLLPRRPVERCGGAEAPRCLDRQQRQRTSRAVTRHKDACGVDPWQFAEVLGGREHVIRFVIEEGESPLLPALTPPTWLVGGV